MQTYYYSLECIEYEFVKKLQVVRKSLKPLSHLRLLSSLVQDTDVFDFI